MPAVIQKNSRDISLALAIAGRVFTRKIFFILVILGALVTGAVAYTSKPLFMSEVTLLYQDRGGPNPLSQGESTSPRRIAIALQERIFSHTLLEKVIRELGLYPTTVSRMGTVAAVEQMQKHDLHFVSHEGYTSRISFESTSPELAQRVAARVAELLIQAQTDARMQEAKEVNLFLEGERTRIEKELRRDEEALTTFVAKHPEVIEIEAIRGAVPPPEAAPDSSSLGLEMQALQLRAQLARLRRQPAQTSETGTPADTSAARLRVESELSAAQRELADRQAQFTERHPDVRRAAARVALAKAELRHLDEAAAVAKHAPSPSAAPTTAPSTTADAPETQMVREQLELVEKQVQAVRSQSRRPRLPSTTDPVAVGRLRAQYAELERRRRESRDHHELLENRQFQAEMQALFATQGKRGDLVVVDPAYKPAVPIRSPRPKIILIGTSVSLFLGLAVSLLLVLRDDRLRRAIDLHRFDLPPLLCEVPPP